MSKQHLESRRNIISGFTIHDIDESGGTYYYYGFINVKGEYVIMRMTAAGTEFKYSFGITSAAYATAWAAKASQTYANIA